MDHNERPPDWSLLRRAILVVGVLAPVFAVLMIRHDVIIALTPLFLSHVALLYPTLNPHSQWWGPVVRSFATDKKEVWLTIDDGPSASTTPMLDILDRFQAKATFFVVGKRIASREHLLRDIGNRGHQLGNHTFTHPSAYFWCSPPGAIRREISRCADALPDGTDQMMRAPVGIKNFYLHPVLSQLGSQCIGWTVRGFDTLFRDPSRVSRRIAGKLAPGAIILLHERDSDGVRTDFQIRCLEAVLQEITDAGYCCVVPSAEQFRTKAPARSRRH